MTWFQMYLFTRLDTLCMVLNSMCSGLLLIMCFTPAIIGMLDFDTIGNGNSKAELKTRHRMVKAFIIEAILFVIAVVLKILVPTQKEMAAIIVVPAIVNNEQIQQFGKNGLDLTAMTTEYLKDVLETKQKNCRKGNKMKNNEVKEVISDERDTSNG